MYLDPKFFPTPLRGHGIMRQRTSARPKQPICVQGGCRGEHDDLASNVHDWMDDHKIPNTRADRAQSKQRAEDAKALRERAKYTPAPRVTKAPPHKSTGKCESCGRKPAGVTNDEGLTLGLCGRCWKIGHSINQERSHGGERAA